MDYIKIKGLLKEYGLRTLFKNLNFTVTENTSLGIVGPNGHGKSTLINIILGNEEADDGNVTIAPNISIGYFSQYSSLKEYYTINDEMEHHFKKITDSIARINELSILMSDLDPNSKEYLNASNEYQKNYEFVDNQDGFNLENKIDFILNKFNFPKKVRNKKVSVLSGGEKSRLMLAKILSTRHDVLILDEPTNHLDINMINWLESYLLSFKGPKILISHDRFFLDNITTKILEIASSKWELYTGNYSKYEQMKAEKLKFIEKQYLAQQKQIKKDLEFVNKNIARATTSNRAKSRKKALEKMEVIEKPQNSKKLRDFSFSTKEHVSKEVIKFINLEVGFKDKVILNETNLTYFNNNVIALIGKNGIGKTTLVNAIVENKNILKGKIKHSPSTKISYFDQKQDVTNVNEQVIDIFAKWFPHLENGGVRKILGQFLFDNDGINKKFKNLSGGERSRLFLAKIFEEHNNFIILDEPTNHLDIPSQKVLENALKNFNGALFLISHDRYFINSLATQIWELENNKISVYDGNYNDYIKAKNENVKESTYLVPTNKHVKKQKTKNNKLSPNKQRELDNKILLLEKKLDDLQNMLFDEKVYTNYEKHEEIQNTIETTELELLSYYEQVID